MISKEGYQILCEITRLAGNYLKTFLKREENIDNPQERGIIRPLPDDKGHVPGSEAQESMDRWLQVRAAGAPRIPPFDGVRFMAVIPWSRGYDGKRGGTADAMAFVPAEDERFFYCFAASAAKQNKKENAA